MYWIDRTREMLVSTWFAKWKSEPNPTTSLYKEEKQQRMLILRLHYYQSYPPPNNKCSKFTNSQYHWYDLIWIKTKDKKKVYGRLDRFYFIFYVLSAQSIWTWNQSGNNNWQRNESISINSFLFGRNFTVLCNFILVRILGLFCILTEN